MARLGILISPARRLYLLPSPWRSLSSAPIKPISYPVKPQELPPPQPQLAPEPPAEEATPRVWTRKEAKYVARDAPKISPVSYPTRVAPLPEYKPVEAAEGDGSLDREARKIEEFRSVLGSLGELEEADKVPFPRIIRLERKPAKVVLDLHKAIKKVKGNAKRNFVESIELHARLAIDSRRSDQLVRGAVSLPHGTGKAVRVAVFAEGPEVDEARAAGADVVGGDELVEEIREGGGKLNFDKCISTHTFMPRLGKIARILGPRGLMPNPKLGSVTRDISGAVKEAKCGRVDFKMDKTAIVHLDVGKVNFSEDALRENIGAFINALLLAKPAGLKKTSKYAGYVNSVSLCSTMGPGFPISMHSLSEAADHYNKLHPKSAA